MADKKYRLTFARSDGNTESVEFTAPQGPTGPTGPTGPRGYGIGVSVVEYGAKGDGSTNDTAAFQNALANNRVVFVPGGTYVLSGTLVIRENCCLELSQDTILKFTQTSGNCIEMRGSAVLKGNHAVISAAFGLTGNVISMDTSLDGEPHNSIPPYEKSCPQWKRQRFIYDVNIIKPNSSGFNRPLDDGKCNGTAIYMHCDGFASITWMWGIVMSGIRIAGGFAYGIRAYNVDDPNDDMVDDAWNHDMRIEAVIEACEIGVALENCNGAHLDVSIQPNKTPGGNKYAKQGVMLSDSRFVDMMRSRVWDWHIARNDSEEYKHIALYGNCRGLLLDDFLVTEHPDTDIRDDIYTDTPSNFDTMTILQEPANKWFKSIDNEPYFNDGINNKKLMLASDKFTSEQMEFISPADGYYTYEDNFTNLVTGYQKGYYIGSNGSLASDGDGAYATTDFIPIDGAAAHTYRIGGDGISWNDSYGQCRIAWYTANKTLKGSVMAWTRIGSGADYPTIVEDENAAFAFATNANVAPSNGAAYFRVSVKGKGENLIVTIDEPIDYKAIWHGEPKRLDDSIKVKAENVIGLEGGGGGITEESDPTVPSWAKQPNKPSYTASEVGALPASTKIPTKVSELTNDSKFATETYVNNQLANIPSGGGGVSSWNDLTDKPFGESENAVLLPPTEFFFDGSTFFVTPGYIEFIPGKTYTVNWNGVDYATVCFEGEYNGMLLAGLGNPAAVGGPNNSLPFVIACMNGMIGSIPLDGSTAVTVGITGYGVMTIDPKYLPVQAPYVYEIAFNKFENDGRFVRLEPEIPLALVEAVYQRRQIYMKVLGTNNDGTYDNMEYIAPVSFSGNYQYIQLAMGLVDKTSEVFKIREGTGVVINGKELTTQMMLALMAIRINARIWYYSNQEYDFGVWFIDDSILG